MGKAVGAVPKIRDIHYNMLMLTECMRTSILVFVFFAFATLLAAMPISARIDASPAVHIFEPGAAPETNVTVTNSGAGKAFVITKVREVMVRGETDEKLREDSNPETLGLIATPGRMVLEKGERRGVRIVPTGPALNDDRVWRVLVSEVAGKVKDGQSGVAFLLAYDILVIKRPDNARVAVSGNRVGKELTLTNSGNSFGMITEVRHCLTGGACTKLPDAKRLYAGKSWSVTLPSDTGAVEVVLQGINRKEETLRF
jgi:P pilus assembly chaperone PapD